VRTEPPVPSFAGLWPVVDGHLVPVLVIRFEISYPDMIALGGGGGPAYAVPIDDVDDGVALWRESGADRAHSLFVRRRVTVGALIGKRDRRWVKPGRKARQTGVAWPPVACRRCAVLVRHRSDLTPGVGGRR